MKSNNKKFQIFSSSVVKYLKVLEAHISTDTNIFVYRNGTSPTSEPTNPSTPSNWQAIAPPQSKSKSTETIPSSWTESQPHLTDDDNEQSFITNGTEVEFEDVDDTTHDNTHIGYVTTASFTKHVVIPGIIDNIAYRTTRSNSLTATSCTTSTASKPKSPFDKQRSVSLTGISAPFIPGGIGYIWDEAKPKFPSTYVNHNIGMSHIPQWLKSLRLHKYAGLFSNKTFEEMLETNEHSLERMHVTQGARNKLLNCIQKLKERYDILCQIEKDLICGQINIGNALIELSSIVQTPMKPIEPFNKGDVASQFLKVLNLGECFLFGNMC